MCQLMFAFRIAQKVGQKPDKIAADIVKNFCQNKTNLDESIYNRVEVAGKRDLLIFFLRFNVK